ncbi:hypothetical protein D3C71_1391710 [compost metagenome]
MDTIGADQQIAVGSTPIREAGYDPRGHLFQVDQPCACHYGARLATLHGAQQQTMQIAPVHHEVWETVTCHAILAQVEQGPRLPGVPQPDALGVRLARDALEFLQQAQGGQHGGPVGTDLQASADFAEFRCLLVDRYVEASLHHGQARGEATDAGTNDQDLLCHVLGGL